ncbi:SusC/RagA family TonB-linked outer membrane protein [Bacteroidia bacterium]|nr:SusC/RagA family TonB-linked outer membrane protein [Bacteroidia bacterium]
MRISLFLLFFSTAFLFADNSYSQKAQVTINQNKARLESILEAIESQTDYLFLYNGNQVDVNETVTVKVKNMPVNKLLDNLFADSPVNYVMEGTHIVLTTGDKSQENTGLTQSGAVRGTILDAAGDPLPGVNISIKGTKIGTVSNEIGKYSINVPDKKTVLVFSYLGFTTQEITVGEQTTVDVTLNEDTQDINEVIVIGYGTQKKSNLTGAVSSVKMEEISKMGATGISSALQGRAAGVQVINSSGDPREDGTIIIRGVGNIRGMGPLYVIDGVPSIGETGFNMNLKDIADVQILRDASSSAIYGSRAAGGVILITTKRGAQKDKTRVNFSANAGVRNATFLPELLGVSDYKKAWGEINPVASTWSEDVNTDWVDYIYKSGFEQDYNVSIQGGGEKNNYYVSAGYKDVDGVIINSFTKRYSIRFNGDYQIGKMVKVGHSVNLYAYSENPPGLTSTSLFRSTPMMQPYDENGEYGKTPSTGNYQGGNWATDIYAVDRRYNKYSAEGNIYVDIEPVKDLHIKATGGGYYSTSMRRTFEPKWFISGQINNQADHLDKYSILRVQNMGNIVASYQKRFGAHEIKALAGIEGRSTYVDELEGHISAILSSTTVGAVPDGFPVSWAESSGISNVPNGVGRNTAIGYSITRMMSYFGRINYAYADKYLFEFNLRDDVSDRFAPKYRHGLFPSAAVGWRITEEHFLKDNVEALSNLKLRLSYGSLGNDGVGSYAYLSSLSNYEMMQFNELPGTGAVNGWGISKVANEAIHWETVTTSNVGLDIGLFKNKLNIGLDYYIRSTKDMLYTRHFAFSTGMASGHRSGDTYPADMNLGEMRNQGLEIVADYSNKIGNVRVNAGFNVAFNRNKILNFGGETLPVDEGSPGGYWSGRLCRTELGRPISQFYGLKTNGLIPDQATIDHLNELARSKGNQYWFAKDTGPGDIWYLDTNDDGTVNDDDRVFIGNPLPKMTYGFNIGAEYRNFDIGLFFSGIYGNDVYNGINGYYNSVYNDYNTSSAVFNSSFMYGNGLTGQPRWGYRDGNAFIYDPNSNYKRISDFHVENGSFLRLQNLQIGYKVPTGILQRINLSNIRIYYSSQNLFVLSKVKNTDPEVGFAGNNSSPLNQGIIAGELYPKTRLHSFGIEISF